MPLVNDEWCYILMDLSTPSYGSHPIPINRTKIECMQRLTHCWPQTYL